jgi:hypothetical protein
MIKQLVFLALGLSVLSTGCVIEPQPIEKNTVYLGIEANTDEEKLFSQDVMHELSRGLSGKHQIVVDELRESVPVNLFSEQTNSFVLKDLMDSITVSPSDDQAFIASINRVALLGKDQESVTAIIISSGTVDKNSLSQIKAVAQKIQPNTRLYILGVSEENRLPMSQAFSNVKGNVKLGSSDVEMLTAIGNLKP